MEESLLNRNAQEMNTERFVLKEIEDSDIENIHKGLSNPIITQFYDVHFPTLEATQEQMDWYSALKKEGTGIWWGIYTQEGNQFCGAIGYNALDKQHKKAEIGMWLLQEYWGQGILKEVMPIAFNYGFTTLGLNRIEGFVIHDNAKCKRALEKVNFSYEGTMRDAEVKNGKVISIDIYSILKHEFLV